MFGWKLVREAEITLQTQLTETRIAFIAAELRQAKQYSEKCERLIDHERQRVSDEQERADRATDALLLQNGTPPVTATGRRENEAAAEERKEAQTTLASQLAEIYSENAETFYDDLGRELPLDLQEAAAEIMKKSSN